MCEWCVRGSTFAFRHSMHFKTFFLSSCFMRPAYKFSYQSIYKHAPMIRCWIIIIEFGASHLNRTVNATHRLRNHHAYKIICICSCQSYYYFVGFLFGGVSHVLCICCRPVDVFFFFSWFCLPSLSRMQTNEREECYTIHHPTKIRSRFELLLYFVCSSNLNGMTHSCNVFTIG